MNYYERKNREIEIMNAYYALKSFVRIRPEAVIDLACEEGDLTYDEAELLKRFKISIDLESVEISDVIDFIG